MHTFESWLKYQGLDLQGFSEDELKPWRETFERGKAAADALRTREFKPGTTGGYSYAIAIEDGADLRLSLWIKRSLNGECFIFQPRDPEWDPHASYHSDGTYHQKSYGEKLQPQKRQRLDQFKGTEYLGSFMGHGVVAPRCDATNFTAVLRVPQGVLEARSGSVLIDLVEPGIAPALHHRDMHNILLEQTFRDSSPWVVVAIALPRMPKA